MTYDGRCKEIPFYHDRLRTDGAFFDAEAIPIGKQDTGDIILALAVCPGCGTTVSKVLRDDSKVVDQAHIDGRGWRNRNPGAPKLEEQVICNHYSLSREQGLLGTVPRRCRGRIFDIYRRAFKEVIKS